MPFAPPRPGGSDPESRFHQWVWDSIHALRPQDVPGAIVQRTSRGTAIIPLPGKGVGGITISAYRVKEHWEDYIAVVAWNGTTEGEKRIAVGKPPKLQFKIKTETVDGIVIGYGTFNVVSQTRVATSSQGAEPQRIVPRYLTNDIIYAVSAPTFIGLVQDPENPDDHDAKVAVSLLDLNIDGRAWAAE